jgi:hypothetical protein
MRTVLLWTLSLLVLLHSSTAFRESHNNNVFGLPLPPLPLQRLASRRAHDVMLCAAAKPKEATFEDNFRENLPKMVDVGLQGLGLAGSIALLGFVEYFVKVKLFAPTMMVSGLIFFAGETPPQPNAFLSGTLCGTTLSLAVLTLCTRFGASATVAAGGAAGAMLMW